MESKLSPAQIVERMMKKDGFSQWLGIEVLETGLGICRLKMKVREEMCNGFMLAHGGISYSFADSALAFSSNSHGIQSVSIETSISHIRPVNVGDVLIAHAIEKHSSKSLGVYEVEVSNQDGKKVALFKGTVFRTGKIWE
jgi:acyl-CoA thioesterase